MKMQLYLLLAAVTILVTPSTLAAKPRPNIVLLMADDFGYECLSCNGGESYSTPHLDRLAADGMRFTHAYSQPVCTPSRVKIMTGLSNARNYVDFGLLKKGSRTFGHMLQDAGYQTAVAGKWQLYGRGNKSGRGTHPRDAGFHEYCLWQVEQRNSRYWKPLIDQNGKILPTTTEDFGPDIFWEYSKDFISRNKDRPFLLYFPMVLTHAPFVNTPENNNREKLDKQQAFAGMVSYADTIVGRFASHLKALGITDNTLLLFTGDNGTPRQIQSVLNGCPIKGGKAGTTDAGTHVPLVANWPGTIKPGVCNDLVDFSDFVPTLAEASGGTHPYASQADGRSFFAQLTGEPSHPRDWIYCFNHPRTGSGKPQRFVRDQRWKLYGDGRLIDVTHDPEETSPLDATTANDEARAARTKLKSALLSMPSELATTKLSLPEPRQEIYKTIGDVQLGIKIFVPIGHQPSDQRPAALFFFGGGWSSGSMAQFEPHCRYLAGRGMVSIVADYRVSQRHQTSPFECVQDAKSAVRWVRANANRLGIDPQRLAVGGGSAGGHLAAATATIEGLNEAGEDSSVSCRPDALLLFNPVYDNGPGGYGHKRLKERYREISPLHNIRAGMPPAIVFLGTNDGLIPVATAQRFQREMREVGSRSELFLYAGQEHGFFNHPDFKAQAAPTYFYQTMLETDRFLTSLGYLSGEPTLQAPRFELNRDANDFLDVSFGGRPIARYMFAFDPSTPEKRHETYKPFLHVFNNKGDRLITKGAGGLYTHHRGIFLGFSRTGCNGKSYDLWHMKQGVQVHRKFTKMASDDRHASFTSEIGWQDNAGLLLVLEQRTLSFLTPPDRAYTLIEMHSRLRAMEGDVTLSGDPEHAGAQFRPADDIVATETEYFFHAQGIDPTTDLDLPWVGETFRLATGKARHSVVILNHPDNPQNTRYSAYRDYGRFGAYPEFKIAQGESAILRYRWIVTGGKMLPAAVIEAARQEFLKE